jgi:hypothetical protein
MTRHAIDLTLRNHHSALLYSPETAQLACKNYPTLHQAGFQSFEPHHYLLYPALWVERVATTCPTLARRLHRYQVTGGDVTWYHQLGSDLFPNLRSLQRRLVHYSRQCGVPVTAQRLRHTFASHMLASGMPVSSLQRYLGHEYLDTTMIYAEVSDSLLRQDYYQGIATLDPSSDKLWMSESGLTQQRTLRQLVDELKTPGLEQSHHDEILNIILANIG